MNEVKVIFTDLEQTILVLGDYTHTYYKPEEAAHDYALYMKEGTTEYWDGNEGPEAALYDEDHVREGRVIVMTTEDIDRAVADPKFWTDNSEVRDFINALKG